MADITIRNPAVVSNAPRGRNDSAAPIASAARVFLKALGCFLGVGDPANARGRRTTRGFNDTAADWSLFDPSGTSTTNLIRSSNR